MVGSASVGANGAARLVWPGYIAFVSIVTLVVALVVWRDTRDDFDRLLCIERAKHALPAPAPADVYLRRIDDCTR